MSNLGLGGLVSGVNTDDIITKIMNIESKRIDLETKKQADLVAKQDAWKKVRDSLATLRGKLDGIRLAGAYQARKASVSDETLASVTATSGATVGTHVVSDVIKLAQAEVRKGALKDSASVALSLSGSISINTEQIEITATDTLYTIRDKVNGTADAGVTAEVVKVVDAGHPNGQFRLVLSAKSSGAAGAMTMTQDAGTVLDDLGFSTGGVLNAADTVAQDSDFKLDGVQYNTASNVIADAINGLTITLKKAAGAGVSANVTVSQDPDAAATKMTDWVTALNDSLALLRDLTKFDEKTHEKGALNGDSLARSLLTSLQSTLSAQVFGNGSVDNVGAVGITSGAYGTDNYGKVLFDDDKFKAQLQADETGVARLFGGLRKIVNVAVAPTWTSVGTPTPDAKETLSLSLGGLKSIDEVKLFTPDGAQTSGLKDFNLYYIDGQGQQKLLRTYKGYTGASTTISFDPVEAQEIRLEVFGTYNSTQATISSLEAHETNRGVAVQMYRYVNGTLAYSTGPLDARDTGLADQIKAMDDRIAKLNEQMTERQAKLKAQFDAMEQALAKLNSQGSQITAMLSGGQSTR